MIDTVFSLYILAVLLRFLLQWVRADFYNPISQALVAITNPPLKVLRRIIPGLWGIDFASLLLLVALSVLWIGGVTLKFSGVLLFAVGELLQLMVYVFMVTIFVRIILSWVNPGAYNPAVSLLISLTEPIMAPARRLLPPIGGLDLSPMLVFLFLGLTLRLVVQPVLDYGRLLLL